MCVDQWVLQALISGKSSHVPRPKPRLYSPQSVHTSLCEPEGVRTVLSALGRAEESIMVCFEQPKTFIQQGVLNLDIVFPSIEGSICAVHPRMGVEVSSCGDDDTLAEGAFFPLTITEDSSFSCSRQWTIFVRSFSLNDGQNGIQIIPVPVGSVTGNSWVLSRCLVVPKNFVVNEVGFYGDDGKSTRLSGSDDKEMGKEGRQALGLLLENGSDQELWLIQYDRVTFEVKTAIRDGATLDVCGLEIAVDSVVYILPHSDDTKDEDDFDPSVIYAKSKSSQQITCTIVVTLIARCCFSSLCPNKYRRYRRVKVAALRLARCRRCRD